MQEINLDPASDAAINNTIINMRLKKYKEIIDNARMTADVQEFSATLELGMEFIETEITDEILKDTGVTLEEAEQAKRVVKCYVKFREFLEGFFRQTQIPDVPVLASFWKKMADTDTETRYSFLSSLYKKGKLRDDWMSLWDTFQKEHPVEKPQTQMDLPVVPDEEASIDLVSLIAGDDGNVCEGEAALKSVDEDGCTVITSESPPETIDGFPIRTVNASGGRYVDLGFKCVKISTYTLFKELKDDLINNLSTEEMVCKYNLPKKTLQNHIWAVRKVKWPGNVHFPSSYQRRSCSANKGWFNDDSLHDQLIAITDQNKFIKFLQEICSRIVAKELEEQYDETIHDELSALRAIIIARQISIREIAVEIYGDSVGSIKTSEITLSRMIRSRCCRYFESVENRSSSQFLNDNIVLHLLDETPYEKKHDELLDYGKSRIETCNNQECKTFTRKYDQQPMVRLARKDFTEPVYRDMIRTRKMLVDGMPQLDIAKVLGLTKTAFHQRIIRMRAIPWPDGLKL